jgi:hypothetical protein
MSVAVLAPVDELSMIASPLSSGVGPSRCAGGGSPSLMELCLDAMDSLEEVGRLPWLVGRSRLGFLTLGGISPEGRARVVLRWPW